jgi:hypothetical protein
LLAGGAAAAIAIFIATAALAASPAPETEPAAEAAAAFGGRWQLEPARSKFVGVAPRAMIVMIEPAGTEIRYRSETTRADGSEAHSQFAADVNGGLALQTGTLGLLAPVQLKRIDAHTIDARYIRGMRVVASSRWVTEPDRGQLTMTTTSEDASGTSQVTVAVFRQVEQTPLQPSPANTPEPAGRPPGTLAPTSGHHP